ncbi:transmembrane protein 214-like protein [Leptotrombidium deliense]|uniref:Transmembrane protein 214-like protein n=1 Tax=Leptotrombidium deliense TaxID=299467 RepID=A0A443SCX8_9ACAR|nr:transmembrane protein 214-like protein [Leptotrombidium deliense]
MSGKENISKKKKKGGGHGAGDGRISPSKSLEECIKEIKVNDLVTILGEVKAKFPDNPSIWLKDLASFINQLIVADIPDPLFPGKQTNYPMCLLPKDVFKHISTLFNECTKPTLQLFQDHCFQEIISHMSRGNSSVAGYRLILQCLGHTHPEVTINNLQRIIVFRESHQNRPPICLSLLWCALQAGYRNLNHGLKIWMELVFPVMGMKSYSKYAIESLDTLLRESKDLKKKSEEVFGVREFFLILDFAFASSGLQGNLQSLFRELYGQLKILAFGVNPSQNLRNFFPSFLLRLNPQASENLKQELLSNLEYCLTNDIHCFNVWRQLYTKNLLQSSILLQHLLININKLPSRFPTKVCKNTLIAFKIANEEISAANKHETGASDCREYCQELLSTMSSRRFPWSKMLSFLFLISTCLIAYDFHLHGSYEKTVTGRYLKESGIQATAEKGWSQVIFYSQKSEKYLRQNVPVYYNVVKKYCDPYFQFCVDQLKLAYDFLWDVSADLRTWVNKNSPFVIEKAKSVSKSCISYAENILSVLYKYTMQLLTFAHKLLQDYLPIIVNNANAVWMWLLENVFV